MNDIVPRERGAIVAQPQQVTPMQMLAAAVERGMDTATLKELMALNKEWEANEARKAYADAMVEFKADPPKIYKNAQVDFTSAKGRTNYKHATLDNVNELISKRLHEVGISARWTTEQFENGLIRVTCILTHRKGHSEPTWLQAGRDDSGNKNSIQAVVSTVTYLERQTLLSATGMAVKNQDDDAQLGEGAGPKQMDERTKENYLQQINALTERKQLESLWQTIASECTKIGDIPAYNELKAAVGARVKALAAAPAPAPKPIPPTTEEDVLI